MTNDLSTFDPAAWVARTVSKADQANVAMRLASGRYEANLYAELRRTRPMDTASTIQLVKFLLPALSAILATVPQVGTAGVLARACIAAINWYQSTQLGAHAFGASGTAPHARPELPPQSEWTEEGLTRWALARPQA